MAVRMVDEPNSGRMRHYISPLGRVTQRYVQYHQRSINVRNVMIYLTRRLVSATHPIIPRPCRLTTTSPAWHTYRQFNSTALLRKKVDVTQKSGEEAESSVKEETAVGAEKNEKKGKKHGNKTSSLRRVAVEAQRSRQGFVKGRGSKRFIDPHVDTKVCAASPRPNEHS